jgi:hypothetical protein
MAEKRKFEFFLLRYVTDAVKGEFVNFGLVALQDRGSGTEMVDIRFPRDWERVLRADPQADVEVLEATRKELEMEIGQSRDRATLLRRMEDSFSGVLQLSTVIPVITEKAIAEEIQTIAKMYLDGPKLQRMREPVGRRAILDKMTEAWENAGVAGMVFRVPVDMYTKPGDPFAFDFGYKTRTGREMKLFHAVSMRTSVDAGVLLAARYPKIAAEMGRLMEATPVLRAVIEDGLDEQESAMRFALEMMKEAEIRVSRVAEMADIARTAGIDLGA